MSTILQALQKNTAQPNMHSAVIAPSNTHSTAWRIIVSCALLVIIALLSTLIYLQLNPLHKAQPITVVETPVVAAPIEPVSRIQKVVFETQALPEPLPAEPIIISAAKPEVAPIIVSGKPPTAEVIAQVPEQSQEDNRADNAPQETPQITSQEDQELNYDDVPENLKKRFELALLLNEIEENEGSNDFIETEPDTSDSDIHQMSSSFQKKVEPISYQSHVYSSVPEDRWIRINNEVLKEGQFSADGTLQVLEILPQRSIFRLQRQSFSLESLNDWAGY